MLNPEPEYKSGESLSSKLSSPSKPVDQPLSHLCDPLVNSSYYLSIATWNIHIQEKWLRTVRGSTSSPSPFWQLTSC